MKPPPCSRVIPLLLLFIISWLPGAGLALTLPDGLVDAMWLYEHLDEVVVLDVRDEPDTFVSRRRINSKKAFNPCGVSAPPRDAPVFGHIPGAVFIPWEAVMVDRKVDGVQLLQMVPEPAAFQALLRSAGVNDDSAVVVAGRGMSSAQMAMATRLFWTLKYYGHDNVALLDGGTAAWIAKNRRVRFNNPRPDPGNFTITRENPELLATTAEMERFIQDGGWQIVDVRGQDYYDGLARVEKYVPPNGEGHLPTAVNLPAPLLLASEGPATFLRLPEIVDIAARHQVAPRTPTIFYCNVGLQGSLEWFIWHELLDNKQTRLYDGSMHAWSSNPDREVTGF